MTIHNIGVMILSVFQTIAAILLSIYYALESLVLCFVPRSCRRYDVTDKVALITGGGSGLGRRVAQRLAKRGAVIVSWDVDNSGNEETARLIKEEGGKCFTYTVNLCDKNAIYKTAKNVQNEVGKVDILINNAGICSGRPLLECSDDAIQRSFDVNILAHFWTTKAFLPAMMAENSGHIVTIASVAGYFGINRLIDYCSTKFAAVGFDEGLRMELYIQGYTGIHTTVVCPYYINTGMFEGVQSKLIPILEQETVADEIADAILLKKIQLILPWICSVLIAFKNLLSIKSMGAFSRAIGACYAMDSYIGRHKQK